MKVIEGKEQNMEQVENQQSQADIKIPGARQTHANIVKFKNEKQKENERMWQK
jgi:hypothetical protein